MKAPLEYRVTMPALDGLTRGQTLLGVAVEVSVDEGATRDQVVEAVDGVFEALQAGQRLGVAYEEREVA